MKLIFNRYTIEIETIKKKFNRLAETFHSLITGIFDNFNQSINEFKLNICKNLSKNIE